MCHALFPHCPHWTFYFCSLLLPGSVRLAVDFSVDQFSFSHLAPLLTSARSSHCQSLVSFRAAAGHPWIRVASARSTLPLSIRPSSLHFLLHCTLASLGRRFHISEKSQTTQVREGGDWKAWEFTFGGDRDCEVRRMNEGGWRRIN